MGLRIEHVAIQVPDPVAMADWYVKHLGMSISRKYELPTNCRFLMSFGDQVMLEIYNNPKATVPDYRKIDTLHLHIAFYSENIEADRARLLAAGATPETEVIHTPDDDYVTMMRDPWGIPLQLVKRTNKMLK
jgi:catechol 2,3-dioxygenase-like lactoylglutathione lyase family enzyme